MSIKLAAEIFRDYETDGAPSSGPHKPIKPDIRAWAALLELAVGLDGAQTAPAIDNAVPRLMMWR